MKFKALESLLSAGNLRVEDLEGASVTPDDFQKLREGTTNYSAGLGAKPEPSGKRQFRYVFNQQVATGYWRDLPLANSWSLSGWRERHSPVMLSHNYSELPVGRGGTVVKNKLYKDRLSMLGHVKFAERELSEVADIAFRAVEAGLLNCGSVGFDVVKMRKPTEEEVKEYNLGPYSSVFEKCELVEYSVCSVGAQAGAGVIYSDEGKDAFEGIIEGSDYSADAVSEVREAFMRVPTPKTYHNIGQIAAMAEFMEGAPKPDHGFEALSASIESVQSDVAGIGVVLARIDERMGRLESADTPAVEEKEVASSEKVGFDNFVESLISGFDS